MKNNLSRVFILFRFLTPSCYYVLLKFWPQDFQVYDISGVWGILRCPVLSRPPPTDAIQRPVSFLLFSQSMLQLAVCRNGGCTVICDTTIKPGARSINKQCDLYRAPWPPCQGWGEGRGNRKWISWHDGCHQRVPVGQYQNLALFSAINTQSGRRPVSHFCPLAPWDNSQTAPYNDALPVNARTVKCIGFWCFYAKMTSWSASD